MVKKVFCVLLLGIILTAGLALAARVEKSTPRDARDGSERAIEAMAKDEVYGVRDGEVYRFDAQRRGWIYKDQKNGIELDTLRHFTAEGTGAQQWEDKATAGVYWDSLDTTTPVPQDVWFHVDDVMVLSGDSAWWCGNPDLADSVSPPLLIPGGYQDLWYQSLTTPSIDLTDADSCFLIYEQFLKCEKKTDFPYLYSWDGYNVRVSTDGGSTFDEIYPYRLLLDSSFYRGRTFEEWDKLRCWEAHWDAPVCHRDSVMGGFSGDQDTTWSVEIFDLRQFVGETVQIQFAFGSDWAMNTIDDGYGELGDTTWHGLLLDDILVVEGIDSLDLSTVINVQTYDPSALGGTQLFLETCEAGDMPHKMTAGYLSVPATGSSWHPASIAKGAGGLYMARDGDDFTDLYFPCMEDKIVAPKIAKADLPSNLADLWLMYWLKGNVDDPDPIEDGSDWTRNCFQLDGGEWYSISLLHGTISYIFQDYTNSEWMGMDRWSDDMRDLTPLLTDTFTIGTDTVTSWDTLQVAISFESDLDPVTAASKAFRVDDVTISGRIGAQYDVGLSAVKLPWPNAVDQDHLIDSVAVTNYGFNTASAGQVQVYMEILDTLGSSVFGPTQVALFPSPQIDPLETEMVPLDTTAKIDLNQEGVYDFVMWTTWTPDSTTWNDTLKVEYTPTKDWYYPYVFQYPAGQGQMRYHDNGFYSFPSVWRRVADTSEVCAVRFDPDEQFDEPIDARLALFYFYQGGGKTYNLNVYDEGIDDDHPGSLLKQIAFTSTGGDSLDWIRIELDTVADLQHRVSDFWLGIDFGSGPDTLDGMSYEPFDPDVGGNWGHSYFYTDTSGTKQFDWVKRELDWWLTCVVSWRTVFAEAIPSKSGPPKNSSGNLYLDWPDVNQAKDYLIYRSTDLDSPFALLDSTAAGTSNYTDVDVVGDLDTSYYYLFHTRHMDGGVYDKTSAAIGEFDKYLSQTK